MSKKKNIKLKDLVNEAIGGVVGISAIGGTSPLHNNNSNLSDIVEDIYGHKNEDKFDKKAFNENLSNFNNLGKLIYREGNLRDVAKSLSELANGVKENTIRETEDWFDKVTVGRNMKELTTLSKSFGKFAEEAQGLQERMSAVYEDMAHIIGRYYEIPEGHVRGHDQDDAMTPEKEKETKIGEYNIDEGDYEEFFQKAMKKFGIKSPAELDDEEKKKFFNYVDANYKAKSEED